MILMSTLPRILSYFINNLLVCVHLITKLAIVYVILLYLYSAKANFFKWSGNLPVKRNVHAVSNQAGFSFYLKAGLPNG